MAGEQTNLSESYYDAVVNWGQYVANYVPIVVAAHGVTAVLFGAAAYIGVRLGHNRAMKSILSGDYHEDRINIYDKRYLPTGELNEETGNEFHDQEIVIIGETTHSELFPNKEVNKPILEAMKKARKESSPDEPIIYMKLPEVVGEENWPAMRKAITSMAVKSASKMFNAATSITDQPPTPRHRPVRESVLPLLVLENSSTGPEERMLLVRFPNGKIPSIPALEDVRFEDTQSESIARSYAVDEGSKQANHHKLFECVLAALEHPDNSWLKDFSVDVHTGKWTEVPEPREAVNDESFEPEDGQPVSEAG